MCQELTATHIPLNTCGMPHYYWGIKKKTPLISINCMHLIIFSILINISEQYKNTCMFFNISIPWTYKITMSNQSHLSWRNLMFESFIRGLLNARRNVYWYKQTIPVMFPCARSKLMINRKPDDHNLNLQLLCRSK